MNYNKLAFNIKKSLRRFTEYPLVKIDDQISDLPVNQNISPIVYQTWENQYFGKTHSKELIKFRAKNPDLSFKIYDNQTRNEYMKNFWGDHKIYKIFEKSIFGPMKADIFRYCILLERGGYYFDISKGCNIQLTKLHSRKDNAIITFEENQLFVPPPAESFNNIDHPFNYFLQWGLGFTKGHQILENMINEIIKYAPVYEDKNFKNPKLAILSLTGPGMYTKVIRDYLKNNYVGNQQLGIKFNENGIFKLKGSTVRHYIIPSYTYKKNSKILSK